MKNGKKYLLTVIPIVIVVLIICLFFTANTTKSIPLADGLRFGMSPKQAAKVLGEHCQVEYDAGTTGKNAYTYKAVVLDQEATVTCYFWNDRQLTEVVFLWESESAELSDQAYTCIYDHYHNKNDFFTKEDNDSNAETKRTSLGIDNGVTGIFYNLYETHTSLQISCLVLS